jgi:hypothetical protein
MSKSVFAAIDDVNPTEKLPQLAYGTYTVEIGALKHVKGMNGSYFIPEMKVLESAGEGATPAGTRASQLIRLDGRFPKTAFGNVKLFAAALTGKPVDDITGETIDMLVSDEQPARGEKLKVTVSPIKTKAGTDFPLHTYSQA